MKELQFLADYYLTLEKRINEYHQLDENGKPKKLDGLYEKLVYAQIIFGGYLQDRGIFKEVKDIAFEMKNNKK